MQYSNVRRTSKHGFIRGATALNCIDVAVRIDDAKREFAIRDKFAARDKFDGNDVGIFVQLFLSSDG